MIRRIVSLTALAAALAASAAAQQSVLPPVPEAALDPSRAVTAPEGAPAAAPLRPGSGDGFVLRGIDLEGATALSAAELRPIWADLVGQPVSVATLTGIAGQIGAAYRARGHVLSQAVVPAQTVTDGRVRILVIEGFVDDVSITGGAANQQRLAGKLFAPVATERPLRLTTLERGVLLSRDAFGSTFGETVETVLEPSPDVFGAADLGVLVTPQPFSGFVTADNRGSRLYGGVTVAAGSRTYNLLGLNERIDLLLGAAPEGGRLTFGSAIASVPIEPLLGTPLDGARFELELEASRADPDYSEVGAVDGLTTIVNRRAAGARLVVPFRRTRSQNLFAGFGIEVSESEDETRLDDLGFTETDRLAVLEARLTWDFADDFRGVNLVDAALRQGLDIGWSEVAGDGPAAGHADFTLVQLTASRLQAIGSGGWSVYGELTGQYAATTLPNAERFYLGASTIGRGFAPGNTSGDSGLAARLELRRTFGAAALRQYVEAAEVHVFTDWGRAYDRSLARDGDRWEDLGSVGVGARVDVRPWLSITPEVVRQVSGTPADTSDGERETRFFLGATARF